MKTVPHDKFFEEYVKSVLATFTPNNEISPTKDENCPWEQVDYVDLREQELGTVIFLRGIHRGADYRIRINKDNHVGVWRNLGANGLTGPLESIASWQGSPEGVKVEEGIIRTGSYSLIPYFSYDKSKSGLESVLRPTDIWGDAYLLIFLQKPEK